MIAELFVRENHAFCNFTLYRQFVHLNFLPSPILRSRSSHARCVQRRDRSKNVREERPNKRRKRSPQGARSANGFAGARTGAFPRRERVENRGGRVRRRSGGQRSARWRRREEGGLMKEGKCLPSSLPPRALNPTPPAATFPPFSISSLFPKG